MKHYDTNGEQIIYTCDLCERPTGSVYNAVSLWDDDVMFNICQRKSCGGSHGWEKLVVKLKDSDYVKTFIVADQDPEWQADFQAQLDAYKALWEASE
tara:strand:- start:437 stop:727 length:291 start_codon:yes stop_codon:yes gene_type:complete